MAEKKSWRDYSEKYSTKTTDDTAESKKTGSWRDYSKKYSSSDGASATSEGNSNSKTSWRDYSTKNSSSIVGGNIANRVNNWLKNHNSYLSGYQKRYSGRKGTYEDAYVSDSAGWLDSVSKQADELDAERQNILSYMDQHKGYLDAEWIEQIRNTLAKGRDAQLKIRDSAKKDNEWWTKFTPNEDQTAAGYTAEKVYQEWQAGQKQYTEDMAYDVEAGTAEVDGLIADYENWFNLQVQTSAGRDYFTTQEIAQKEAQLSAYEEQFGTLDELEKIIDKKTTTTNRAKQVQTEAKERQEFEQLKATSEYKSQAASGWESYEAQKTAERAQEGNKTWWEKAIESYAYAPADTSLPAAAISNAQAAYRNDTSYREPNEKWSTEQKDHFGYLWAEDQSKAYAYAEQVNNQINAGAQYNQQQAVGNWASQNIGTGTLGTLGAIATAPLGLADFLDNMVEYSARGTITQKGTLSPFDMGQAAQSGIANKLNEAGTLDEDLFIIGGKGWGDVYSLGVSAANSLVSAYTLGGTGTLVNFIGQGGASGVDDALSRGATPEQALLYGTIVGAAEGLTEFLPAEKLLKVGSSATLKNWLMTGLKQGIGEFAEEGVSAIIGNVADNIIMADKSNFNEIVRQLLASDPNLTEAEAKKKAWGRLVSGVIYDAMGGFLTGSTNAMAISGGKTLWASRAGNKDNIKAATQYGESTKDLIKEGLKSDPNSESYKLAKHYEKKTAKGKSMTGYEIRQLVAANEAQFVVENYNEALPLAKQRLAELGETGDVDEIAKLVAKRASGQKLTDDEKSTLVRSQYGAKVAKEMTPATADLNYKSLGDRVGTKARFGVSDDGKTKIRSTGEEIDTSNLEFATVGEGQATFKVEEGREVSAGEMDFADENLSYIVSAVSNIENITTAGATAMVRDIIDQSKPLSEQLNGIDEAYTYGNSGYSEADLKAGKFTTNLTDTQMMSAYKLGQAARAANKTNRVQAVKRMRTAVQAATEKAIAEGKAAPKAKGMSITYNYGGGKIVSIDEAEIKSGKQEGGTFVANLLLDMNLGTSVEFFSSYITKDEHGNKIRVFKDDNGVEQKAYSGVYRKSDGTIRIDLNAYNGRGLTLNALSHELTHFVQQWSPEKYEVLADFLIKTYEKTDMSMHDRVLREQARLKRVRGEDVSYNEAYDEVVANAMGKMFDDGKLLEKLKELASVDKSLVEKILEGIKEFFNKFMVVYKEQGALFHDTADIMAMKKEFERLQNIFAEALVDASQNKQAYMVGSESNIFTESELQTLSEAGFGFDENTKSMYSSHFSTAYKDEIQVGKNTFNTDAIVQLVAKGTGRSIEDARKWVKSEQTIANMVLANPEFLDFEADNRYEAIKKNSDYPQGTVDLSNLCPKREEFTAMFDMLQKKYPNKLFTAQDVAEMRKILASNDITVACGACFVEDRRQLLGEIADTFINMWKEAVESGKPLQKTNAAGVKSDLLVTKALAKQYGLTAGTKIMATDTYIPTQYDLTTYEGFKLLEKNHPTIAMGFNRYNNSRGQQSARLIEGRAEYNRQILGWSDAKVRSVNNNGGLRIFSFSDFEVVHLLDLVQVIIDCAAKGVKIQGYTKIPAFAKLVRGTGIKLNRSLIPKGDYGYHMENGKVVLDYDTTEGIDYNDENFIDDRSDPDIGNIVIGINPTQIGAAMLDPFIDYIIPFHSNKAKEILKKLGTGEWVNYKESQHEKDINTGKASKHNVNIYTEVINKYHPKNKVEFVEAFLKECKRQGKIPRYAEFLNVDSNGDYTYREGYHKLLVDFKMFDAEGNILPQGNITPSLDENFMKELLNAEIDKKQSYEFPQKVYDAIDKQFGEQYSSQETDLDYDKPIELSDVFTLRSIGRKSVNQFRAEDIQKAQKWAHKYFKDIGVKSPFFRAWFGDWRAIDKTPIEIVPILTVIGKDDFKEFVKSQRGTITNKDTAKENETGWQIRISSDGENNTRAHAGGAGLSVEALTAIRSLVENSILLDTEVHEHHSNNSKSEQTDRIAFDHKLYSLGMTEDNRVALYRITVEEKYQDKKHPHDLRFHNLKYIEKVADFVPGLTYAKLRSADTFRDKSTTTYSVSDLYEFVKKYDAEFHAGEIPSADVVDKDGHPVVFYHGTPNKFTTFIINGRYGIYLTANKQLASSYGGNIMETYASIKNPKYIDARYALANTMDMSKIAREAEAENYDGVIITNLVHAGNANYKAALRELAPEAMKEKETAEAAINQINESTGYLDKIYDITESEYSIPSMPLLTEPNLLWWAQKESGLMYDERVSKKLAKLEPIQKEIATYVEQYNRALEAIRKAENENASSIADTVYVAFESGQVKDAHNNIGTFDRNNPDTLFSSQETDRDGNTMSDRAREILANAKPKMIGKNEKADIEFDTVRELFNELNSDKDIQALADRVFEVAKEDVYGHYGYASYHGEPKSHLRLPMAFVGKKDIPDGVHGQFRKNTIWGDIVFSYDYFMDESIAPQSKASTILHEVIHAITCSHIESAYRWSQANQGMFGDPLTITDFNGVDERIKAGIELIDVFEQVKSAPIKSGKNLYGQLTAYEMVAEMANVEFRNFLKKQNLWGRIVDAIKRIFGIPNTTAYDAVSDALERILASTTNDADAQRAKIEAKKANNRYSSQETDLDTEGKKLGEDQLEYFGKSMARDRKGRLQVVYHGGTVEYEFDTTRGGNGSTQYGPGAYFTDSEYYAKEYTWYRGGNVRAYYLNIEKMFDDTNMDATVKMPQWKKLEQILRNNGIEDKFINGFANNGFAYMSRYLGNKAGSTRSDSWGGSEILNGMLREAGFDGIKGTLNDVYQYTIFTPNQAKLTTNEVPSTFYDTRYSEHDTDYSNRSLLANAFETITNGSEEYKLIQKYKGYIAELNSLENKLSEFNRQIRKIRFGTEGEYDAEKLKKLESEAKKIAEAINKYDRYLLSLEASEPLRKVIDRERKKEAQKTKAHVQEIQQNKKVRAEQTELRHKIRKAVRDLDKILNRGNKKLNVKQDMQNVVTKALQAADILFTDNYGTYDMLRNGIGADLSDSEEALVKTCTQMLKDLDKMPTDGYDNWQARQEAENRLRNKMSKLNEVFARERKRLNNTTVSSILGELADAYKSLEKSEQSYVQGAYSEPVYTFLKNLQSEVGGTIVNDMTKDQLESVYSAYKMVLTTVRKANQMFNEELKLTREQLGNAVIEEVLKAGGVNLLGTKMGDAISQFDWNNMKPVWLENRIGSDSFGKLIQGLFVGQYNFAKDIDEVRKFKLEMDKKYHPRNWDAEKLYEFDSSTGKKFSLNLQQIMSLYAFSKREQAYSHLLNGGFVFEDNSTVVVDGKLGIKRTYIHKGATSYKLNEATLNGIINSLTAEQKAYVDDMQKYLSDVMGAKGNEVSMQLYGIKMFNEQFYFPLRSSGAYMERAKEAELKKQQGQINLVNSGFTHSVKPEAKNPIILSGFMDVWAEHCNEMSMYHSMVLPMEDFRKVYNYSTIHDEKMDSASVYQTIQDAYGKAATDYIDQLYRELNAGATVDPRETPWKKLISNFKKSAVMLSGSVVVQQFSSIGRAYAVIDPKYFIGAKVNSDTRMSVVEEMKKYAPVAIIKEMGGFDTGTKGSAKSYIMAEQYGKGERIKGLLKDEQYRGDIMGMLPAKADELTWCAIWEAVKRETKAKHSKMDVKSEEFLKLAGERFSEVIEKTQVYDSVLARSANMRSKGNFMQMATAFMAEPTTTVNLLEDAIRSGKAKNIARAFGSVAVSIVLNNALASIVYAMRDDDEDETFIEKYFQSFTSGMIDDINPMSYYPFLKDVYSLFQGYDVERADMSVIADVRDALKRVVSLLGKDTSEMDDDELAEHYKQVNEVFMGLLDAGCSMFGVPVKNIRRDAMGIINAWKTVSTDLSDERDNSWLSFWDKVGSAAKDTIPIYAWTKDKAKGDKLYDAIMAGDKAYLERIKSTYKTEDAYHTAVRKALRENDPRIRAAAQARYAGNNEEYKRIFREIQNEGRFIFDDIMSAINTELSKLTPDKVTSDYTASGYVEAIAMGDAESAQAMKDDIIATKVANGKTPAEAEEEFASSVGTGIKNAYASGLLDEARAKEMLMEYAGKDEEEAASKISYWSFLDAHPEYEQYNLSESNVNKYLEFAEPAEITMEVFVQFRDGTKGLADIKDKWGDVEVTKREQVLEVIDSLPLTWQQKDALYLAAGYSEDKIWDVPW
jgi:hypothetical protein